MSHQGESPSADYKSETSGEMHRAALSQRGSRSRLSDILVREERAAFNSVLSSSVFCKGSCLSTVAPSKGGS